MKTHWLRNFVLGLVGAVVIALGLSIFTAITATPSFSYVVSDLGTLNGYSSSQAKALNDAGQVVGTAFNLKVNVCGFLWTNGTIKDLGGNYSSADGINNKGQVVGSSGTSHAFLWNNPSFVTSGLRVGAKHS